MNELWKISGFALMAALCAFALKAFHRQAGMAVGLAAGMMLFFFALTQFSHVSSALQQLSARTGLGSDSLSLLIKLLGMAYIGEFAVQACRDAGEEGLALKVSLCAKMLLVGKTLPLIGEISQLTLSLLP
ncbi:MAG: hypothetical protein IJD39_10090 [Clostridia bacterium]|nr:hypothetical protein [Clostridia bacterium]